MADLSKTKENQKKCRCFGCPSLAYHRQQPVDPKSQNPAADDPEVCCANGHKPSIARRKGCICFTCTLFKEKGLKKGYYCFLKKII